MILDAVVPAYNEAPTVAAVVRALVAAGVFRSVIVADDGSTDGTAAAAREAGARVLTLSPNRGKGGALLAGVEASDAAAFGFFDADLRGFTADHARALAAPVARGACGMSYGLRDYGPLWNALQRSLPPITGERVVRREVLARIPPAFWSGFRIEAGMNAACEATGLGACAVPMPGVTIRTKWEKVGAEQGVVDAANMVVEVLEAMRDARAAILGAAPPPPPTPPVAPAGCVATGGFAALRGR